MSEVAARRTGPRTELGETDEQETLTQLVVASVASEHSKRAYRTGLEQFFAWWACEAAELSFSRALLQRYRSWLEANRKSAATMNQRLAPVRKLAEEAAVASSVRAVKERSNLESGRGIGSPATNRNGSCCYRRATRSKGNGTTPC